MTWALSNKEPNCDECVPPIFPENKDILDVYLMVRNQHIMGFGGPVDLDLKAVEFALKVLEIKDEDRKAVVKGVHGLYHHMLEIIMAEAKKE